MCRIQPAVAHESRQTPSSCSLISCHFSPLSIDLPPSHKPAPPPKRKQELKSHLTTEDIQVRLLPCCQLLPMANGPGSAPRAWIWDHRVCRSPRARGMGLGGSRCTQTLKMDTWEAVGEDLSAHGSQRWAQIESCSLDPICSLQEGLDSDRWALGCEGLSITTISNRRGCDEKRNVGMK